MHKAIRTFTGYIKTAQGAPLCSAVVVLAGQPVYIYTLSDVNGYYDFSNGGDTITGISHNIATPACAQLRVHNGMLSFSLNQDNNVRIRVFNMRGEVVSTAVNRKLKAGDHHIRLHSDRLSNQLYVVHARSGSNTASFKYIPFTAGVHTFPKAVRPTATAQDRQLGVLRVSSPGYLTKSTVIQAFTQMDVTLDTPISQVGAHVMNDGCMDRMTIWGKAIYYWSDIGRGQDVPLVKIIQAKSHRVVDAAIIFNPIFADNTYGANVIGWNKHSFSSLVKSDHVEFAFQDNTGDSIFHVKLDYISETNLVSSGYASLGVAGGDGAVIKGSASDIYSWGTSLDDNINYYGYELFEDSPETDTAFTPNPDYPCWENYVVYHICIRDRVFQSGNFKDVYMSFVHASPSKNGPDTVPVTKKIQIGQNDPFSHVNTFTIPDIQ